MTNRRSFIRTMTAIGGTGLLSAPPLSGFTSPGTTGSTGEETKNSFQISIFQTTDVHCQVHPHDEMFWENGKAVFRRTGGYAHLATYLQEQKRKHPDSFFIDTGDMFQGSELSVKTTGNALVPILNEIGYDLYLPGNWEVVYGKQAMQHLLGALNAPTICANMFHDNGNGGAAETIFNPYHIWEVRGARIGFVGYTDPFVPIRQSPAFSKGIVYKRPEENLEAMVSKLRKEERCNYVILLSHLGLSQQIHLSSLDACMGVDYILGGDTHERVRTPIQGKHCKIVEPGAFGSFVGKLTLTISDGQVKNDAYELVEIESGKYKPSKRIEAIIASSEKAFEDDMSKVIGYSTVPLYRYFVVENTIDTLIIDALKWKMPSTDIVLSNGFRFCPPRSTPDNTGNIPITNSYLYDMLPVNSVLRTGEATGKQIIDWMENELNNVFAKNAAQRMGGWMVKFKGMQLEFNAYGEPGKRVQKISILDQPLDMERVYNIAACEREGDPADVLCRLKKVNHAANTPYNLHDVIRDYLAVHSPVNPKPHGYAKILDGPPTLLTQVYGVDYQFT